MRNQVVAADVVRPALVGLELALASCYEDLNTIANYYLSHDWSPIEMVEYEFHLHLERTFAALAIVLDAAGLSETRSDVATAWKKFLDKGLTKTEQLYDYHVVTNDAYDLLRDTIGALGVLVGNHANAYDQLQAQKLEELLRGTANLVHRRGNPPMKEKDVQDVMNDYLGVCFNDYVKEPVIAGGLKAFRPDGGVRSLKTAIEFKFVRSRQELNTALGGIFEDSAGYKGSADWVRFFSVVYMTEPFEREARFKSELVRGECFTWTPILVNGSAKVDDEEVDAKPRRRAGKPNTKVPGRARTRMPEDV